MKVAITGGLGYIGSRITGRLLSEGHEVIILDNLSTSVRSELANCEIINCDITSSEELKSINLKGVNALLHLAAQSSGPKSFEIPEVDIRINILGTLNMIKWCRDNEIGRILFASSFVVYGDTPHTEILKEEEPCNPKSIYALSKYTCEKLLKIYAEPLGIDWNVLRMFNVYGPGQDLSRKDQGMVSIFLSLVKDSDYIPVKGRLDRFRDFIYIDDVVQGWLLCLFNKTYHNQIYNLGSGAKTYLSYLINTIIEVYGKTGQVRVEEVEGTPGDIMGCYADISKISAELGYKPKFDLQKGVKKFKEWADQI